MRRFAETYGSFTSGLPNVAMPLIGAGLANGEWAKIARRIEEESTNYQPIVYVESEEKLIDVLKQVSEAELARSQDEQDFLIDLEKAAHSPDASDDWLAGFVRQYFGAQQK